MPNLDPWVNCIKKMYSYKKMSPLMQQLFKTDKDINKILREKDKMKEDVIANLSDKLIMLSERLDAIEKSQS